MSVQSSLLHFYTGQTNKWRQWELPRPPRIRFVFHFKIMILARLSHEGSMYLFRFSLGKPTNISVLCLEKRNCLYLLLWEATVLCIYCEAEACGMSETRVTPANIFFTAWFLFATHYTQWGKKGTLSTTRLAHLERPVTTDIGFLPFLD